VLDRLLTVEEAAGRLGTSTRFVRRPRHRPAATEGGGLMSRRERRVFGSVRRLSSGRWQVRYRDLSGVLHTGPHTFTSKADAARYLAMVEADLHRGIWADPKLGADHPGRVG
jgi:hypothetical protein